MGCGDFDIQSSTRYLEYSWYYEDCSQLGYLLLRRQDRQWELRQISTYRNTYYRCLFIGIFASHNLARRRALNYANHLASRLKVSRSKSLKTLMSRFSKTSLSNFHTFQEQLSQVIDKDPKQRSWAERVDESQQSDDSAMKINFWNDLSSLPRSS